MDELDQIYAEYNIDDIKTKRWFSHTFIQDYVFAHTQMRLEEFQPMIDLTNWEQRTAIDSLKDLMADQTMELLLESS